jgi:hypothetical protein
MTARLSLKHFLIARMQPDIHLQQLDWIALKIEIFRHRDDGLNIDHAHSLILPMVAHVALA